MVKRTLTLTESVAFELDNLATENNCDLETLILTNLSKAYNRFGFARKDCIRRKECAPCLKFAVVAKLAYASDLKSCVGF